MSINPDQYHGFLKEYEKWAIASLTPARAALRALLADWRKPDYWKKAVVDGRQPIPTPIQRATSRIKRPESAADKIMRKPESFPDGLSLSSIKAMPDALGGRIITYFLSGLPLVHKEIMTHPNIELCTDDPPKAYLDDRLLRVLGLNHLTRV